MIYLTRQIKNPYTNKPYALEISERTMADFQRAEEQAINGQSIEFKYSYQLIECWEFTFFPAFRELSQVWTGGYSKERLSRILADFGTSQEFIERLLADDDFVAKVKPWFNGIACDGKRASRTLSIVHNALCKHFPQSPA